MFEQHPVPQQISSYQFRLVGDMTLKQFLELAGGAGVGLLIHSTPFPGFVRWPLIIVAVLFGAALAFLPIQDRPLEQWVFAFFRSIYRPTEFSWEEGSSEVLFLQEPKGGAGAGEEEDEVTSQTGGSVFAGLELAEKNFLKQVSGFLTVPSIGRNKAQQAPMPATVAQEDVQPVYGQPTTDNRQQTPVSAPEGRVSIQSIEGQQASHQSPVISHQSSAISHQSSTRSPVSAVPQIAPVQIRQGGDTAAGRVLYPSADTVPLVGQSPTPMTGGPIQPGIHPDTNTQVDLPSRPITPNTIVGQAVDTEGKIIKGAILEVKDKLGRPVRALRTNPAGHFLIVTPLLDGEYTIVTEAEGYVFENVSFTASGQIIDPMIIRANKKN